MSCKSFLFGIFLLSIGVHAAEIKSVVFEELSPFAKEKNISAACIGIFRKRDLTEHVIPFGTHAPTKSTPVSEYTLFRIGELTQLFTAEIFHQMVRDGRLVEKAPLEQFLSKSILNSSAITIGDLASHKAGFPRFSLSSHSSLHLRSKDLFHYLSEKNGEIALRSTYQSSTIGYALLSYILQKVAKQEIGELFEKGIFHPYHLEDSTFFLTVDKKRRVPIGFCDGVPILQDPVQKRSSILLGSTGLYSTGSDMMKYLKTLLSQEKSAALISMEKGEYKGRVLFEIASEYRGFSTYMGCIPSEGIGCFFFSNNESAQLLHFGHRVLDHLLYSDCKTVVENDEKIK